MTRRLTERLRREADIRIYRTPLPREHPRRMAFTWHTTPDELRVVCHDGSLMVRCPTCDATFAVGGAADVPAAREFCLTHRHGAAAA